MVLVLIESYIACQSVSYSDDDSEMLLKVQEKLECEPCDDFRHDDPKNLSVRQMNK